MVPLAVRSGVGTPVKDRDECSLPITGEFSVLAVPVEILTGEVTLGEDQLVTAAGYGLIDGLEV